VTELRKLAAEASEQKRRLEIIGEILSVSQEKFHHFVESSTRFISENERIIRQHEQPDGSAIAELFRNMHTIKGNARTYSLQHLTNIVHEAEQAYEALRRSETGREWDQEALMQDLARVRDAIESYAKISEVSLGRKGPGMSGSAEHYVVVDAAHISDSLRLLDQADPSNVHELLSMRDSLRQTLRRFGTETIGEALSGALESLPSLARELGKEAPVVRIDDNGYRVRNAIAGTLRNVFTHLLRNSIDHGIEPADERIAHGKSAAGAIDIEVGVDHGALQITLSDDGQGLALANIKRMAIDKGWMAADADLGDEAIAEFIFRPGFSTAEKITEVSGRGVGMDAVRNFVKREHGTIELRFTDDHKGAPYRRFQTVVSLPDRFAVDSLERQPTGAGRLRFDAVAD
jgi:chemotaxis protein histidine kinase CheA